MATASTRSNPGEESPPSWFGPGLGDSEAGAFDDAPQVPSAEGDSQFFVQQPRRLVNAGGSAFQRLYRAFLGARMALGLALIATLLLAAGLGGSTPRWTLVVCGLYALEATAFGCCHACSAVPRCRRSRA